MVNLKLEFNGGLDFHLEDFTAYGDYIADLPFNWLESIRFSLQKELPLCLEIDEEGSEIWILGNGRDTIIIDDRDLEEGYHYTLVEDLDSINFAWMILKEITKGDIFQRFVRWEFIPKRFTVEDLLIRERELKSFIQDCKKALKECTENDLNWRELKLFD